MTALAATKHMSADDFLSWVETQESGRYELYNGQVFAMAPEREEHGAAKFNVARALADAIARVGAPCRAYVDSLGVRIDEHTLYPPDALVNCGDRIPADSLLAPAPVIIVEVLSPSSRRLDTNIKLSGYFRLPSVTHYLIVDLQHRVVLHYRRADKDISLASITEGAIALDPPGLSIQLNDIFA